MFGRNSFARTRRRSALPARRAAWFVICLAGWIALCAAPRDVAAVTVAESSTSREAQNEAAAAIPFDRMTPQTQARLRPIVENASLYRRLPAERIECEPDLYLLMVRYPEIVVNIWHLMNITNVEMERTGDFTLSADDGAGTTTELELVYGTRDVHVLYSRGLYEGPLFRRPVEGDCVLLLRSDYQTGEDGRVRVTSTLDVFVQIDHAGVQILARTLQPLLGRTADVNFVESIGFLGRINEAAEAQPEGIQGLASRLEEVDPAVRDTFGVLAGRVAENVAARQSEHQRTTTTAMPTSLGAARP